MQDRHGLGTDLRAATRFCWRHPLLSLTVVLTLAVGIGVNTAVFSVLNATYLKKLPIANADRFVSIDAKDGGSFTYPEYLALRDLPACTRSSPAGERRQHSAHRSRTGDPVSASSSTW